MTTEREGTDGFEMEETKVENAEDLIKGIQNPTWCITCQSRITWRRNPGYQKVKKGCLQDQHQLITKENAELAEKVRDQLKSSNVNLKEISGIDLRNIMQWSDKDYFNYTLLHWAASYNQHEFIHMLFFDNEENKANTWKNQVLKILNETDSSLFQWTALEMGLYKNSHEASLVLLQQPDIVIGPEEKEIAEEDGDTQTKEMVATTILQKARRSGNMAHFLEEDLKKYKFVRHSQLVKEESEKNNELQKILRSCLLEEALRNNNHEELRLLLQKPDIVIGTEEKRIAEQLGDTQTKEMVATAILKKDPVGFFLVKTGLGNLFQLFAVENLTIDMLDKLTDGELLAIGVKKMGDRMNILRAIAKKESDDTDVFDGSHLPRATMEKDQTKVMLKDKLNIVTRLVKEDQNIQMDRTISRLLTHRDNSTSFELDYRRILQQPANAYLDVESRMGELLRLWIGEHGNEATVEKFKAALKEESGTRALLDELADKEL